MLIVTTGCDRGRLFEQNQDIPDAFWEIEFKPEFHVDIVDTTANYAFYINVRNTEHYRYSNLFVFLFTHFPNGNITRDTIECVLAEPSGRWLGHHSGNMIEHQILLNPALRFPLSGQYLFRIEHAMREDMKGITSIGIRIEESR